METSLHPSKASLLVLCNVCNGFLICLSLVDFHSRWQLLMPVISPFSVKHDSVHGIISALTLSEWNTLSQHFINVSYDNIFKSLEHQKPPICIYFITY